MEFGDLLNGRSLRLVLPFDDWKRKKLSSMTESRKKGWNCAMANSYREDVECTTGVIRTVTVSFDDRERRIENEFFRTQTFDDDTNGSRRKVKGNPLDGRFLKHSCSMTEERG